MSILFPFVALPMIILGALIFVFQSSVSEIENEQFLQNCPLPVYNGNVTIGFPQINEPFINYTIVQGDGTGTASVFNSVFTCEIINGNPAFSVKSLQYDTSTFGGLSFNSAWFDWLGTSIGAFFERAGHVLKTGWLFFNAPAEVTQIQIWTFINFFLVGWFGIGMFIIVRGGS